MTTTRYERDAGSTASQVTNSAHCMIPGLVLRLLQLPSGSGVALRLWEYSVTSVPPGSSMDVGQLSLLLWSASRLALARGDDVLEVQL